MEHGRKVCEYEQSTPGVQCGIEYRRHVLLQKGVRTVRCTIQLWIRISDFRKGGRENYLRETVTKAGGIGTHTQIKFIMCDYNITNTYRT